MSCLLTKGRLEGCKKNVGGLYKVYFANFGTLSPTIDANNVITSLSASTLYEFELKGTNSFVESLASSRENGSTFVTQTLTIDLKGIDYQTNNELKLMAYGRPQVVVVDNYGDAYLAGKDFGMELITAEKTSGVAMGDKVAYTLTLVGTEREYANFLSGSTFANPFVGMTIAPTIIKGT